MNPYTSEVKGYIYFYVNGHFVNYYRDGLETHLKNFIVNKTVNIKGNQYLVKKIEPIIVGPNAISITKVYVEK